MLCQFTAHGDLVLDHRGITNPGPNFWEQIFAIIRLEDILSRHPPTLSSNSVSLGSFNDPGQTLKTTVLIIPGWDHK